ncbi:hypothetical protein M0813_30312 [Anaeramoeba flamelloides]|uniref:Uncharacterized protein n=1 Tax=Anaeramoeba flamelloides TaxID=1746091 RepID=A0ABQ8XPA6_9EUKA|nr:hypothetical protein M0813_30312 [Anaeramoeba flamelloides]
MTNQFPNFKRNNLEVKILQVIKQNEQLKNIISPKDNIKNKKKFLKKTDLWDLLKNAILQKRISNQGIENKIEDQNDEIEDLEGQISEIVSERDNLVQKLSLNLIELQKSETLNMNSSTRETSQGGFSSTRKETSTHDSEDEDYEDDEEDDYFTNEESYGELNSKNEKEKEKEKEKKKKNLQLPENKSQQQQEEEQEEQRVVEERSTKQKKGFQTNLARKLDKRLAFLAQLELDIRSLENTKTLRLNEIKRLIEQIVTRQNDNKEMAQSLKQITDKMDQIGSKLHQIEVLKHETNTMVMKHKSQSERNQKLTNELQILKSKIEKKQKVLQKIRQLRVKVAKFRKILSIKQKRFAKALDNSRKESSKIKKAVSQMEGILQINHQSSRNTSQPRQLVIRIIEAQKRLEQITEDNEKLREKLMK